MTESVAATNFPEKFSKKKINLNIILYYNIQYNIITYTTMNYYGYTLPCIIMKPWQISGVNRIQQNRNFYFIEKRYFCKIYFPHYTFSKINKTLSFIHSHTCKYSALYQKVQPWIPLQFIYFFCF